MQNPIIYLVLKRLRAPLILLVLAYTIAITGLTLIPGIDDNGEVWHVSFFHAFYFFSYVATTIGFGEIPYEFTDYQRLWVTFCIYLTVISWFVAIGKILSLFQDPTFKSALRKYKFSKNIDKISSNFFIICGYGETGEILVKHLFEKGYNCVVIDNNPNRINLLDLESSVIDIPYIEGDASDVSILQTAGINNKNCKAIIAITNNDKVNVKIAVAAKLLQKSIKVVCRVESKEAMANAKSFETDYPINPYKIFAENFGTSFRKPTVQQSLSSLLRRSGKDYSDFISPPKGKWIVCGYNRFGREVARFLDYEGIDFTVIESKNVKDSNNFINGKGTEAVTLRSADISNAVGVIAGTGDDADNLSIMITSRQLQHKAYLVARQNLDSNRVIFQAAEVDLVMESARLLVWQIAPLLTQPYLSRFIKLARHRDEERGIKFFEKLHKISDKVPETYPIYFNDEKARAVTTVIKEGNIIRLQDILVNKHSINGESPALPLMLVRDGKEELLPKISTPIKYGDVFLLASKKDLKRRLKHIIHNEQDLHYFIYGEEKPVSIVVKVVRKKYKDYKQKRKLKKQQIRKQKTLDKVNQEKIET